MQASGSMDVGSYNGMPGGTDLRGALNFINSSTTSGTYSISFALGSSSTISLGACLPVINLLTMNGITIDGFNGGVPITIDGGNSFRGFLVRQASTTSQVIIQNINFLNCLAKGGNGGDFDGGGGLGAGGGLFVGPEVSGSTATNGAGVIISNVAFTGCQATGGNGGAGSGATGNSGAGGGGMGGNGGAGGGFVGLNNPGGGGGGGLLTGSAGGAGGATGGVMTAGAGGGGGGGLFGRGGIGSSTNGSSGGGGGGGGGASPNGFGGDALSATVGAIGGSSGTLNMTILIAGGGGGGSGDPSASGGNGGGLGGAGALGGGGGGGSTAGPGFSATASTPGGGGIGGGGGGAASNASQSADGGIGGGGGGGPGAGGVNPTGAGGYGGGWGGAGGGGKVTVTGPTPGFGGGGGGTGGGTNISVSGSSGGLGGFGGGGGGSGFVASGFSNGHGGPGGFGAGGGGGIKGGGNHAGGLGGQGAGSGSTTGGGGGGAGAGLGGSIFAAGSIEIQGGVITSGSAVFSGTLGAGASGAAAAGADIFIMSSTNSLTTSNQLSFNPTGTTSIIISSAIGDDSANTLSGQNGSQPGTGSGITLVQNGTGTVVLGGVNTYIGGTIINAGTLSINADIGLGLSTSTLGFGNPGGTLAITGTTTSSRPITIAQGAIGGFAPATGITFTISVQINSADETTGVLVKSDLGDLFLTATSNQYTGGTILDGGVLGIVDPTSIGPGPITFSTNSTLQLLAPMTLAPLAPGITLTATLATLDTLGNTVTITSPLVGPGGLATITASSLYLTSTVNSFAGGITFFGGLLGIDSVGTGPITFSNDSTFQFLSPITLTPTTPGITMSGTVVNFDTQGNTVTVSSPIIGVAGLTMTTSGLLNLTDNNTYTGPTTLLAGTLNLSGSLTSPVTVMSGATLEGTGLIAGAVNVESGGTINPGPLSPLTIANAPYISAAGSITNFEVNSMTSSLILVTGSSGTAMIAGTANITFDPGAYTAGSYTLLSADGGLTGTYDMVTFTGSSVLGNLLPTVSYIHSFPGLVLLNLNLPFTPLTHLTGPSGRGNRLKFFKYLNTLFSNPKYLSFLSNLNTLGKNNFFDALDMLNIEQNGWDALVTMNLMYSFADIIENRMCSERGMHRLPRSGPPRYAANRPTEFQNDELLAVNSDRSNSALPRGQTKKAAGSPQKSNCFWVQGLGDWASQDSRNQLPEVDFQSYGAFVGYDYFGSQNGMVGIAAGYARTHLDFEENRGFGHINSYILGPYGSAYVGNGYFETGLFGMINQNQNTRHISYPGFLADAESSHNSYELALHLGAGYDITFSSVPHVLEPFVVFDYVIDCEKGYAESGAGIVSSQLHKRTISMLRSEGGFRFYQVYNQNWGVCVLKELIGYVNKTPFNTTSFTASFIGTPNVYSFESFTESQNLLNVGFEMLLKGNNGLFSSFTYDGEFFSGYLSNELEVAFGVYF